MSPTELSTTTKEKEETKEIFTRKTLLYFLPLNKIDLLWRTLL